MVMWTGRPDEPEPAQRTEARESLLAHPLMLAPALLLFRVMSTPDTTPLGLQRDPDEWKTGDEPMTAAQRRLAEG